MGIVAKAENLGRDGELRELVEGFFIGDVDEAIVDEILSALEEHGHRKHRPMQIIAQLTTKGVFKKGVFSSLYKLCKSIDAGEDADPDAVTKASSKKKPVVKKKAAGKSAPAKTERKKRSGKSTTKNVATKKTEPPEESSTEDAVEEVDENLTFTPEFSAMEYLDGKVPVHSFAKLFPSMDDGDYETLKEAIRNRGQLEPVTIFDGKIVDGLHRYNACRELGLSLMVQRIKNELTDAQLFQFVMDMNATRRHLTASQKAALAFDLLKKRGDKDSTITAEAKKRQRHSHRRLGKKGATGKASEKAAEIVGVSPRYIEDFKAISSSDKVLAKQVRAGTMTIVQAKRELAKKSTTPKVKPKKKAAVKGSFNVIVANVGNKSETFGDAGISIDSDAIVLVVCKPTAVEDVIGGLTAEGLELKVRTQLVIVKPKMEKSGAWLKEQHLVAVVATNGKPKVNSKVSTVLTIDAMPKTGLPEEFYDLVDAFTTGRKKLAIGDKINRKDWKSA